MAGNEKTLRETLGEVVGETKSNEATKQNETGEGISDSQTGEPKAGETPVYVSGVDISDVPVELRPQVEKYLKVKADLVDKGAQEKYREIAVFKKAQQELIDAGLGVDEAKTVLSDYLTKKKGSTSEKSKRTLDTLIDNSPPETKESLRQLRTISREEGMAELLEKTGYSSLDDLGKDLKDFKQSRSEFVNSATNQKRDAVSTYLKTAESEIGKELVNKYKDSFVDAHLRYGIPIDRLITSVIPYDELKQALTRKPMSNKEKANAITNTGGGVTGSETIDVKKTSMKGILSQVFAENKRKLG